MASGVGVGRDLLTSLFTAFEGGAEFVNMSSVQLRGWEGAGFVDISFFPTRRCRVVIF